MTRVLIAADGSETARHAAEEALKMVVDPQVVLVMVAPPVTEAGDEAGGFEGPLLSPEEADQIADEEQREAVEVVDAVAAALGRPDVERHVLHGDPGPTLVHAAEQMSADLVVLGTGDKGLLKRVFLGSVSHHVVHHAPCPVLVVRGHPDAPKD